MIPTAGKRRSVSAAQRVLFMIITFLGTCTTSTPHLAEAAPKVDPTPPPTVAVIEPSVLTLAASEANRVVTAEGTLTLASGSPIRRATILVQAVGGRGVKTYTNNEGHYQVQVPVPKGVNLTELPIVASFEGTDTLLEADAQTSVDISLRGHTRIRAKAATPTVKAGETLSITGSVLAVNGRPVPQGDVQISAPGAGSTAWATSQIAANGRFAAHIHIPPTTSNGKLRIEITYAGDDEWRPSFLPIAVNVTDSQPAPAESAPETQSATPSPTPSPTPPPTVMPAPAVEPADDPPAFLIGAAIVGGTLGLLALIASWARRRRPPSDDEPGRLIQPQTYVPKRRRR